MAIRPITVDERSPERNSCIAATISAGSRPRIGGTVVSTEVLGGWQPEHENVPGGGSAAAAAVAIPSISGKTLTRLPPDCDPGIGTLSRSAGEGYKMLDSKPLSRTAGEGGPSPEGLGG